MRLFEIIGRQLLAALSNIADLFEILFRPVFRGLAAGLNGDDDHKARRSWIGWVVWVLLFPLRLAYQLFLFPAVLFRELSRDRIYSLLASLPAVLTFGLTFAVVFYGLFRKNQIDGMYRRQGEEAMQKEDFRRAKAFFGRLVTNQNAARDRDKLNWAIILSHTGQTDSAMQVLDSLAPDDGFGYGAAHRVKALGLLNSLAGKVDVDVLSRIRHHLERADGAKSVEIQNGWAVYYLAIGQPENAIRHMESAAEINPQYLITIADIYESKNNLSGRERTLDKAKSIYENMLVKDPLNHTVRILLSSVLIKQGKEAEAEQNLKIGVKLQPDKMINNALSDFYLIQHDQSIYKGGSFEDQLEFLQTALSFDPNHLPVYERLITQSRIHMETEGFEKIQNMLEESIVNGKSTALSHFALGNLLYLKNEFKDSQFHMERAYELDSRFLVIGNNLAWLLAHNENPELDRALDLIKGVVERRPDDARFRDTLASVLMKLGKTDEALTEFERALPGVQDKKSIHEKLAVLYDQVGKKNLAELHRKKAAEMKGNQ